MKRIFTLAAVMAIGGTMAFSAISVETLITDLQAAGYTRIEVKEGPTQVKIEAIKGTTKVETIYDKATGAVLKSETETVGVFENTTPGVKVRSNRKDFVGTRSRSDDDDDDDMDDDNDDDDDNGSSGSNDDDDDDNGSSGSNDDDDDDDDDDNGSSSSSNDDDDDDDNGSSGSNDDDD